MASGDFNTYDCDNVTIGALGVNVDSAFGEGEFISIEYLDPAFKTKVGADGTVVRSKTLSRRAKITLTLLQTAKANALLSTIHNQDREAKNGAGVGPFIVKDRNGSSLHVASKAWVSEPPNPNYANETSNRVWIFECADMRSFDGGN